MAIRLEATARGLEAMAIRLEATASGLDGHAWLLGWRPPLVGWRPWLLRLWVGGHGY